MSFIAAAVWRHGFEIDEYPTPSPYPHPPHSQNVSQIMCVFEISEYLILASPQSTIWSGSRRVGFLEPIGGVRNLEVID